MAKAKAEKEGINKSEVVREAIKALGGDPGPKEIIEYVKQNHGVELKYTLVASYKSNILRKEGQSGPRSKRGGGGNVVDLDDLKSVRELLNRIGEPQLQRLIKVLSSM